MSWSIILICMKFTFLAFQKDNSSLRDVFYSPLLKKEKKKCYNWQLKVKTSQNPLCATMRIFFREIHSRISALERIKATIP